MSDAPQLTQMRKPEPSNHFDERMRWTLDDIKVLFPTKRHEVQLPLILRSPIANVD